MAAWCLVLLLLVCSARFAVSSPPLSDVAVLRELVREWNVATFWSSEDDDDPCRWNGVVVCSQTGSIINLHLNGANLSGAIPAAIEALGELTIMDLSENPGLSSSIPREIGHLRHLTHLKLSGCNFTGNVPQEIYNLHKLQYLDLSNNPHLLVDSQAHSRMTLRQHPPTFSHRRKLLQVNGRTPLPIFFTYIALGCIGLIIAIIVTFIFCRWMSTRRTRNDVFIMTPAPPIAATTFQRQIFTPDDNDGPDPNP